MKGNHFKGHVSPEQLLRAFAAVDKERDQRVKDHEIDAAFIAAARREMDLDIGKSRGEF